MARIPNWNRFGEMPERFPPNAQDSADTCAEVLEHAGLQQIQVVQEDLGYHYPDFESFWGEWWASLFRLGLQVLDDDELRRLRHDLEAAMAPAFAGEGLDRPNVTLLTRETAPY